MATLHKNPTPDLGRHYKISRVLTQHVRIDEETSTCYVRIGYDVTDEMHWAYVEEPFFDVNTFMMVREWLLGVIANGNYSEVRVADIDFNLRPSWLFGHMPFRFRMIVFGLVLSAYNGPNPFSTPQSPPGTPVDLQGPIPTIFHQLGGQFWDPPQSPTSSIHFTDELRSLLKPYTDDSSELGAVIEKLFMCSKKEKLVF